MEIKKSGINYKYEDDGATTQGVTVSYTGYDQEGNSLNATAAITQADLKKDITFDDLTAKQIDALGRAKVAAWFGLATK